MAKASRAVRRDDIAEGDISTVGLTAGVGIRRKVMRVSIATAVLTSVTLLAGQASGGPISYVYNDGSRSHMRSNGSIDEVVRIAKRWSGAFCGRGSMVRPI